MSRVKSIFQINTKLKASIAGVVLEGLLSSCNFLILFEILKLVFGHTTTFSRIMMLTGAVVAILLIRILIYAISYTESQIGGSDVSKRLRIAIGDKMKRIPLGLFTKNKKGFYINSATSEVADYEQILTHKVADITKYIIMIGMMDIYICTINIPAGICMLAASLLLIPSMMISMRVVRIYGTGKNEARSENVSAITEYIAGIQTLRSYGMGGRKNEAVTQGMRYFSDISYRYEKKVLPIGAGYMGISYMALPAAVLFGVQAWLEGSLQAPQLILLIMLPLFVCRIHMTLFINLTAYRNLKISRTNIETIMKEQEEQVDCGEFAPDGYAIELKNVDFSYEAGEPVLTDVNLQIPEHRLTAIVGESGCGKSTILNLISKYYLPDAGSVTIGGCNTANIASEAVLSKISLVDQEVFLFDDTIYNNIRYARPDASEQEIREACVKANCDGFIRKMEQGYDTRVGENGNRLSGGERQRLSVARAMLRKSPIVLLDEATASLDIENELLVKQAIANLLKENKTVVMVAHTMSIICHADQIVVIDQGSVAETGTHEQLLKRDGKYAAMWNA